MKYCVAILACFLELLAYGTICGFLGWNNGGGYLPKIFLFGIVSATFKEIIAYFNKKEEKKSNKYQPYELPKNETQAMKSIYNYSNVAGKTSNLADEKETTMEFHSAVKVLLVLLMFMSGLNLLTQLYTNLLLENYIYAIVQFVGGVINFGAFYLIYKKKLLGVIIFAIMMVLQIPINLILGTDYIFPIIFSAGIRLLFLTGILCISKNGISAWKVLTFNHKDAIKELKEYVSSIGTVKLSTEDISKVKEQCGSGEENEEKECLSKPNNIKVCDEKIDNISIIQTDENLEKSNDEVNKENYVNTSSGTIEDAENEDIINNRESSYETNKNHIDLSQPNNKKEPIEVKPLLSRFKFKFPKISKLKIAFFAILILPALFFSYVFLMSTYPNFILSSKDKICWILNIENDDLCTSIIEKAQKCEKSQLFDKAEEYWKNASSIKTSDYDNLYNLSIHYIKSRKFNADSLISIAETKYPQKIENLFSDAAWELLDISSKKNGILKVDYNTEQSVIKYSESALEINSQNKKAIISKLEVLMGREKWEEAYEWCLLNVKYGDDIEGRLYLDAALCALQLGKYRSVKTNYQNALEIYKDKYNFDFDHRYCFILEVGTEDLQKLVRLYKNVSEAMTNIPRIDYFGYMSFNERNIEKIWERLQKK